MGSRSAAEAVEAYRARRSQILSCVTSAHVYAGGDYRPGPFQNQLSLAGANPVRVSADRDLTLKLSEYYVIEDRPDGWTVEVNAYIYTLAHDGRALLAYHWHPGGLSQVQEPHLHAYGDREIDGKWFGKLHLATGPVALGSVVGMIIRELDVEPRREDWRSVLAG